MTLALKDAARARGLRYGAAHDWTMNPTAGLPQPYLDLFNAQCDLFAPNLGWIATTPLPGTVDPLNTDPGIAMFGKQITGAHFVWHQQIPNWVATITDPIALQVAITSHIKGMAAKYPGAFSWNVVNEVLDPPEGAVQGYRNSQFLKVLGPTFVDQAFIAARNAFGVGGPLLVINDYYLEENNAVCIAKRAAMLALLRRLKAANVPVDALGIQAHLTLGAGFDSTVWKQFLSSVASLGLKILITELDVSDGPFVGSIVDRDRAVAYYLAQFLAATLENKSVVSVVTWDIADRYSWLNGRYIRDDKMEVRPLPFDYMFQPKPAFDMLLAALNAATPRS